MEHFEKHGFSHLNDQYYAAQIASTVWNVNSGGKTPLNIFDFMLNSAPEKTEMTPEEIFAMGVGSGGIRVEC
jgi:hypothetical protein